MAPKPKHILAREHFDRATGHHGAKAAAASQLHADGILQQDFTDLLKELNQERKSVWYEGEPVDFGDRGMEDVAGEVEALVLAAEEARAAPDA